MFIIARTRLQKNVGSERGQAILEFLPVMLLLLTLTFAVIDFGYLIWQNQVIIGLSREGSNLASRDTNLLTAANAVVNDGAMLNFGKNGRVVITAIENTGTDAKPIFVIKNQQSAGGLSTTTKFSAYDGTGSQQVKLTQNGTGPSLPTPNSTMFVTEVYYSFNAITPLGALMKYAVPTTLHDIAYF